MELKRTKGLAVCLAQPKNRRFAGLGCESNREEEAQRAGSLSACFLTPGSRRQSLLGRINTDRTVAFQSSSVAV